MSQDVDPLALAYRDAFESSKAGAVVLEDLVKRFGGNPYVRGAVEAARETDYRAGSLRVITHVMNQINRANGQATDHNED